MPPHAPPSRRGRWLGALVALLVVLALGGAAWYLIHRPAPKGPGGPGGGARVTVGEATARRADVPVYIDALGTVTPVATITLRPQVSGVLTQVLFTEGQMVTKGQLLAQIDPRPFQQALMQAQGTRQRDEAQLANARITLQRYQTLLAQDSIARQDVDTQAALVQQLEGTVTSDRASEKTAQLNLDFTRVTAPISGRVGLRVVDAGNVVSSGDAAGIAVITQINPVDVQFSVPQDRVPDIQARAAEDKRLPVTALDRIRSNVLDKGVFLTLDNQVDVQFSVPQDRVPDIQTRAMESVKEDKRLPVTALDRTRSNVLDKGVFLTLDNQVDVQTGTVRAKARFQNAAGTLFPNQFVNIRLLLRTLQGAVVVPVTALRTGAAGDFVYVVNEDRTVSMRPVKRGQGTVENIVVTEGLKEGERVVTEGGDRLTDGASVRLASDAAARPGAAASAPRNGASGPRREGRRPAQNP